MAGLGACEFPAKQEWPTVTVPAARVPLDSAGRAYPFQRVRGALRVGSSVLVLEGTADGVPVFSLDGSWRGQVGRPGGGPGEFALKTAFGGDAQGWWVSDQRRGRVTRFDAEGRYVEESTAMTPNIPSLFPPTSPRVLSTGELVALPWFGPAGLARDAAAQWPVFHSANEGASWDTIASFGLVGMFQEYNLGDRTIAVQKPLASLPMFATSPGGQWTVAAELRGASVLATVREWPGTATSLSVEAYVAAVEPDDWDRALDRRSGRPGQNSGPLRSSLSAAHAKPRETPVVDWIFVDDGGGLVVGGPWRGESYWTMVARPRAAPGSRAEIRFKLEGDRRLLFMDDEIVVVNRIGEFDEHLVEIFDRDAFPGG